MLKFNNILLVIILTLIYVIISITNDISRIEHIVNNQIPKIAEKAYLTGCLDASVTHNCKEGAAAYRKRIENLMESLGAD